MEETKVFFMSSSASKLRKKKLFWTNKKFVFFFNWGKYIVIIDFHPKIPSQNCQRYPFTFFILIVTYILKIIEINGFLKMQNTMGPFKYLCITSAKKCVSRWLEIRSFVRSTFYIGTIQVLRQHVFGFFKPTHLHQHK